MSITSYQETIETPIGLLRIEANNQTLTHIDFVQKKSAGTGNSITNEAKKQLLEYFSGVRHHFDLPLEPKGTAFQAKVWRALTAIPYGETRSYGQIASAIKKPKASRAVGGANHVNPFSIIVPCHRVVGGNGKLTGYAGGLDKKQMLLDLERNNLRTRTVV